LQEVNAALDEQSRGLNQQNHDLQQTVASLNGRVESLTAAGQSAERESAGAVAQMEVMGTHLKESQQLKVSLIIQAWNFES